MSVKSSLIQPVVILLKCDEEKELWRQQLSVNKHRLFETHD